MRDPRRPLGRADIDDKIDVAPIDAKVERGGADHRLEPARRHCGFDLAALRGVERTMVQRDGKTFVVGTPQLLEQHLGLTARVDEDQRGAMPLDHFVDFAECVAGRMSRPGQPLRGVEHFHDRLRPR